MKVLYFVPVHTALANLVGTREYETVVLTQYSGAQADPSCVPVDSDNDGYYHSVGDTPCESAVSAMQRDHYTNNPHSNGANYDDFYQPTSNVCEVGTNGLDASKYSQCTSFYNKNGESLVNSGVPYIQSGMSYGIPQDSGLYNVMRRISSFPNYEDRSTIRETNKLVDEYGNDLWSTLTTSSNWHYTAGQTYTLTDGTTKTHAQSLAEAQSTAFGLYRIDGTEMFPALLSDSSFCPLLTTGYPIDPGDVSPFPGLICNEYDNRCIVHGYGIDRCVNDARTSDDYDGSMNWHNSQLLGGAFNTNQRGEKWISYVPLNQMTAGRSPNTYGTQTMIDGSPGSYRKSNDTWSSAANPAPTRNDYPMGVGDSHNQQTMCLCELGQTPCDDTTYITTEAECLAAFTAEIGDTHINGGSYIYTGSSNYADGVYTLSNSATRPYGCVSLWSESDKKWKIFLNIPSGQSAGGTWSGVANQDWTGTYTTATRQFCGATNSPTSSPTGSPTTDSPTATPTDAPTPAPTYAENTAANWVRTGEFETVVVDHVFNGDPDNPGKSINWYSMKEVYDNGDPVTGSHQLSSKNFCYVGADSLIDGHRYKHCTPFYNTAFGDPANTGWSNANGLGRTDMPQYSTFSARQHYDRQPGRLNQGSTEWPGSRRVYASTNADVDDALGGTLGQGVTTTGSAGSGQVLRNDGTVLWPIPGSPNGCDRLPGNAAYGWFDSNPTGSGGTDGFNPWATPWPGEYIWNDANGCYPDGNPNCKYSPFEQVYSTDLCYASGAGTYGSQRWQYAEIDANGDNIGDGDQYMVTQAALRPRGATLAENQDGNQWWAFNPMNRWPAGARPDMANAVIDPHPSFFNDRSGTTLGQWPSNQAGGYATGWYHYNGADNSLSVEHGWPQECGQTLTKDDGLGYAGFVLGDGDSRTDYCTCLCELGNYEPDGISHSVLLDEAGCQAEADAKFGSSLTTTVVTVSSTAYPYGCSAEYDNVAELYTVRVNTDASGQLWGGATWDDTKAATWQFTTTTQSPTTSPSSSPSSSPTSSPSTSPTNAPTPPTAAPTNSPTVPPTLSPTVQSLCCSFDMQDTDGDGIPDYLDQDDDGDSINTQFELNTDPANPVDLNTITVDTDGDGKIDSLDTDDDGDSISTLIETNGNPTNPTDGFNVQDTDNDGVKDYLDVDDDNDGMLTSVEASGGNENHYHYYDSASCPAGSVPADSNHCN